MSNLSLIGKRKIFLAISAVLVTLSIVSLSLWGLNFGIDFTGGSLLELKFEEQAPSAIDVRQDLSSLNLNSLVVQATDDNSIIFRFKDDSRVAYTSIKEKISSQYSFEELRYDVVGPSIGKELKSKSFNTIIIVLIIIVLYMAFAFRKVSRPVSSWNYGIAAIIALAHDVLIVLGVFAILGKFYGTEINTPFIAAILTVLGYSVNDTIIVFDRIRENLPKSSDNFMGTIGKSINQTLTRSINTSFTTLLTLTAIIVFGGASIREFVLALAIGVFIGTYSSIFIASPILVMFNRKK